MNANVYHPANQCEGKRWFTHKRYAKDHARQAERSVGRMQVYRCPHCDLWHVGHKVPSKHKRAP